MTGMPTGGDRNAKGGNGWANKWKNSPRYTKVKQLGLDAPCGAFFKLISSLSKAHTLLLVWLYTDHISLNHHLHCIKNLIQQHACHAPLNPPPSQKPPATSSWNVPITHENANTSTTNLDAKRTVYPTS
jgi:hypothetical protein